MKALVAITTLVALLLGAYIGYGTPGIGGAIFYGSLIGIGGTLLHDRRKKDDLVLSSYRQ